ncbi:hypothetical protein K440DRAFT_634986 [Wilcoxina mikolae CBS 423.85]|nr:hypothetical protein K440DRAFT_634986 [Wilcoxina mikolae CBS 423.85]
MAMSKSIRPYCKAQTQQQWRADAPKKSRGSAKVTERGENKNWDAQTTRQPKTRIPVSASCSKSPHHTPHLFHQNPQPPSSNPADA